jgi:hypothetical protein
MFRATALSVSVVYGSQRSACSFHHWFGNFAVQDSMYYPGLLGLALTNDCELWRGLRIESVPTTSQPIHKVTPKGRVQWLL